MMRASTASGYIGGGSARQAIAQAVLNLNRNAQKLDPPRVGYSAAMLARVAGLAFAVAVTALAARGYVAASAQPAATTGASPATAAAKQCHPSYQGACVPVGVSDVDCAGGRGNGPYYVAGPIRVVGPDVYGLDSDGDGIACEPHR
jgi:hypothetical protein